MSDDWADQLFDEKSLWDIYRRSPDLFQNQFNRNVFYTVFGTSFAIALFDMVLILIESKSAWSLRTQSINLANAGFSFGSTVLGFLIAGFTIFATVAKPGMFKELATLPYEGTDLSVLKFLLLNFINIFIHYLCFVAVCLVLIVLVADAGPARALVTALSIPPPIWVFMLCMTFIGIASYFSFALLKLKSFLWNLYSSFLLIIVLGNEESEESDPNGTPPMR